MSDYRPKEGLLAAWIAVWKRNDESRWGMIVKFLNWMPIMFCPFGEAWYFESEDRYGQETWWAPHNWERQPFHLAGGFAVGNFCGWIHPWVPVALIFSGFGFKHYYIDRPQKQWMKALFDTAFWTIGAAFPGFYFKGLF